MKIAHSQRGLTGTGWLMVLVGVSCLGLVLTKMVPHYADDSTIASVLESLENRPGIAEASLRQVRNYVQIGFDTNNIRDFDMDAIEVFSEEGFTQVQINYEKRVNIYGNVDVVMSFKHLWKKESQ